MLSLLLILISSAPVELEGRQIFHDPSIGKNGVACSDCHSTVSDELKEGDGLIRAGHSLKGVAERPFWRGDTSRKSHPTLADAVDVCVQIFQGGTPLTGTTRTSLVQYLKSISPRKNPPLKIQTALEADLNYDREKYRGGDADAGRGLFYKTCHSCHPHGGKGLGPSIRDDARADMVRKIREGNGLLRGSRKANEWMPFYGLDRLSDRQVADIASYVVSLRSQEK